MKIQSPPLHLTPYTLHYHFIKIAISFTSLIPCPIPPTDNRETTEGTPKEGHMTKKALFLRLSPKKVDLIPEKVVSMPKTVDLHFSPLHPTLYTLHPTPEKSRQNTIFLAHLKKKVYLCAQISKRIDMRSNEISYFISFCIEQYKQKHQLTGEQAMLELDKYGVLEYLEEFYEVLHTQSAQWIVEDIDNYINQRKP